MQKNTIWITGSAGRLGKVLTKLLKNATNVKVITTDTDLDVTDSEAVKQYATLCRPTIIINCASLSDSAYCEEHMVEAFRVNAIGARNLATAARKANAKIIQLSTDDVFSGMTAVPLTEFDVPDPHSVYGRSKLAGENYVRELCPKHLIIRSSWVYGETSRDYFSQVVSNGKNGTPFEAAIDRISTPTSTPVLAQFVLSLIDKTEYGIYHASCEGSCSRYEYARTILDLMGYDTTLVTPVQAERNGVVISTLLENLMMKLTGTYEMPNWQDTLQAYIASL
ncbi:MAG: NAD(P)-dependent oxidoreductase [Eubacteriales bacterium]|nr:NAD(P)-dependent oxidoreductase [Eubacteriales bacterium]